MQAGAEKLGVIEASYASAIIGVLSPVSSHCYEMLRFPVFFRSLASHVLAQANMNSEFTSIPRLALVERDSRHKCRVQKELRRYEQRSRFLPNTAFSTPFRGVLPHPTNKSALRAERPTHCLAAKKPGWPTTSTGTMFSLPAPHALRRQASGVRSCADPPPLAAARHRQPNWKRPNGARSRRSAPP